MTEREPEQLTVDQELDAVDGFDGWIIFTPVDESDEESA
jgi:hypothetical protein